MGMQMRKILPPLVPSATGFDSALRILRSGPDQGSLTAKTGFYPVFFCAPHM